MPNVEEVFKALGDPVRIKIVSMLARNGEMCVCRILPELAMTQPAVSHHLAALKNAGLVHPRKQGQWVYYSLDYSTLNEVALAFLRDVLAKMDEVSRTEETCCPPKCCKGA